MGKKSHGPKVNFLKAREALAPVIAELAAQRGISIPEAEEELEYLMAVRAEYSQKFEGSGIVVKDVRWNEETESIEVVVGAPEMGTSAPRTWGPAARARVSVVREQLQEDARRQGRGRVAAVELEHTYGVARAGRAQVMVLVAPEVVRAAGGTLSLNRWSSVRAAVSAGGEAPHVELLEETS